MTRLDPRDRIILEHAPLVAMPRYTNFPPLEQVGHRYIAAEDGIWLELKRPWLHLLAMATEASTALPYGPVIDEGHTFTFEPADLDRLIARFVDDARDALPDECAAWGVWNEASQALEYRPCIAIAAGPGSVTFHRPTLQAHEHLAVDIHSHGHIHAFFSETDDDDDRGEVKLAIVVGSLEDTRPTLKMRLCALGLLIDFEALPGE